MGGEGAIQIPNRSNNLKCFEKIILVRKIFCIQIRGWSRGQEQAFQEWCTPLFKLKPCQCMSFCLLKISFKKIQPHLGVTWLGPISEDSTNEKHGFQPYDTQKIVSAPSVVQP